jgi:hypothetical protein
MQAILSEKLDFNKKLILGFFIFTTFSGGLRKWLITSEAVNGIVLLMQIFAPLIVFILLRGIVYKATQSFATMTYAFLLMGMALNPLNETFMHGFLGFILHFSFWLMIFLYLDNRDSFPIEHLSKALFIVCIVELILAAVQFNLPPSHFINRYSNSGDVSEIAQVGDYVRVSGSFSYISGFGCFLFFAGTFVWGAFVSKSLSNVMQFLLVLLIVLAAFMNGSRTITAISFLFLIFTITEMQLKQKLVVLAISVLAFVVISFYGLQNKITFVKAAFDAFYTRTTELNEMGEDRMRIYGPFSELMEFRGEYPVWGVGLGATYQGAIQKWGRSKYVQDYGYFEEEPERIVIEGGFVLFMVRILLFGVLLWKTAIPKLYLLPIFFFLLFYMPMVFNMYMAAYAFLGIMYLDKVYFLKKQNEDPPNPLWVGLIGSNFIENPEGIKHE